MTPDHPEVVVKLSGEDGNVYNIIGRVRNALRKAGYKNEALAFNAAALVSRSYDDVLQLAMSIVTVE